MIPLQNLKLEDFMSFQELKNKGFHRRGVSMVRAHKGRESIYCLIDGRVDLYAFDGVYTISKRSNRRDGDSE